MISLPENDVFYCFLRALRASVVIFLFTLSQFVGDILLPIFFVVLVVSLWFNIALFYWA